jgi:D-alanyl-lipoteichoic acid acyltransferase DltB (MBOAT superfamily)
MLFNDPVFLFLFLPATLAGYFLLGRFPSRRLPLAWLIAASVFFYSYWNPRYTLILLGSIAVNCLLGWFIAADGPDARRKLLLGVGVAANLGLIAYFKYLGFFTDLLNHATGGNLPILKLVLPLGISFFTFEQITYLVEAYRRTTRAYGALEYLLFVTFFPRLIAGPIVRPAEIIPQFRELNARPDHRNMAVGATIFLVGLMEKVLIADNLSPTVGTLFGRVQHGYGPTIMEAWLAALAYTAQLYFDFSGYSSMAIGLARLIGIRLPVNFNSPYRATSIIDFWRRWHISLSRFLRDYLYIPLGGNRKGEVRRHVNLMLTMAIGGLWHGAGLTFLLWGALHGVGLIINHVWRTNGPTALVRRLPARLVAALSGAITFVAVVVGWVFFRSPDFGTSSRMLAGMFGGNGLAVPERLAPLSRVLPFVHWRFEGFGSLFDPLLFLFAVGALVWSVRAPNVQEWLAPVNPVLEPVESRSKRVWQPTFAVGMLLGLGFFLVLNTLLRARASEFLYFNF